MAAPKATTRVYILLFLLMYGSEDFITRTRDGAGEWLVQFSALDLARRLNCGTGILRENLDKACILGALSLIRRDGHTCQYRIQGLDVHRPDAAKAIAWAHKWGSRRSKSERLAAEAAGVRPYVRKGRGERLRTKSVVPPLPTPTPLEQIDSGANSAPPGGHTDGAN